MQVSHSLFFVMPSARKRIGFLPSEEVHLIIEKLCVDNDYSQSKVTGLLVEEALRIRGILKRSQTINSNLLYNEVENNSSILSNSANDNNQNQFDLYPVDKKNFAEDLKMINEFIEFKYFKKVMIQNKAILD